MVVETTLTASTGRCRCLDFIHRHFWILVEVYNGTTLWRLLDVCFLMNEGVSKYKYVCMRLWQSYCGALRKKSYV